jgi:hypothetical protein
MPVAADKIQELFSTPGEEDDFFFIAYICCT